MKTHQSDEVAPGRHGVASGKHSAPIVFLQSCSGPNGERHGFQVEIYLSIYSGVYLYQEQQKASASPTSRHLPRPPSPPAVMVVQAAAAQPAAKMGHDTAAGKVPLNGANTPPKRAAISQAGSANFLRGTKQCL